MPYPTDVTSPAFGAQAFLENDPASQLSQAAFLLLLRRQLGLRKYRPFGMQDDDDRMFQIPRIIGKRQRYRFGEALRRRTGHSIEELPHQDSDQLWRRSQELAFELFEDRQHLTAAAFVEVCCLRPDPVVRVAAATAGFEFAADPRPLLRILAEETRSDDVLVRDMAATVLARINAENPSLRRLVRWPENDLGKTDAHTSLLVHGTFARTQTWWQPGGDFHDYVLLQVLSDLYAALDRFDWSGGYSDAARLIGASDLQTWLASKHVTNPLLMGHSHGANVILLASHLGVVMREAVLLSCPVHWPKYTPNFSIVPKVVSIRVKLDLVILADLGGQKFNHPQIDEHVLPVWFNHSATHDREVWRMHGVPAML